MQPKTTPAKKTESKKSADESADTTAASKRRQPVKLLRGMKDILPEQQNYRHAVQKALEDIAVSYSYQRIDTPILEFASLFSKSLGQTTDVVDKEMYVFEDKSGDKVSLRPEFTAGIARAYIEHGMLNRTQPVKLFTTGQLFRHDRPQAGRYRQFNQIDCEIIGGRAPIIDAELIVVAHSLLKELGVNSTVRINSIGSEEDREQYINELVSYLKNNRRKLSEESKKRLTKNPLRVLDSKDEQDQLVIAEAPQIVDWLSEDSKNYFITVLEYLDDIGIPYVLEPTLVRGLDYYNDIVFELYDENEVQGSQSALAGGGRYDGLIELLGGQPAGACGFAIGIERLILAMKANRIGFSEAYIPDVFLAQLGKSAQKYSLGLMERLRGDGFKVRANLVKGSLSAQLKAANKIGSRFTLIIGQKELLDGTIIMRDMESGSQEIIDIKKISDELKKRLQKEPDELIPKVIGPQDEPVELENEDPRKPGNQNRNKNQNQNQNQEVKTTQDKDTGKKKSK
ncbi:MAG: histidine--tRNA ligase [bacterium]|nr:histidine--tRNA ligase [bacterium]